VTPRPPRRRLRPDRPGSEEAGQGAAGLGEGPRERSKARADAIYHDWLFKKLLSTFFLDFLDLFYPEVLTYLDLSSLVFLDKEVLTDVTSGEQHIVDLLVKARLRGQESFFLVHVENQASTEPAFGTRMFRYFARLHEEHALPVYPVAVFSYDTVGRIEPDTYEVKFPDLEVLRFRFRTIQLARLPWREFLVHPNPVAAALMAKMRFAAEERPKVKAECLRLLATLRLDPARMKLISGFVDTYLRLSPAEDRLFREEVAAIAPEQREAVMEIVTSWMEDGIQQGRRGEAAGLVVRQLTRRLGPLESTLLERINVLSVEATEDLGEALLDFHEISDLGAWLDGQAGRTKA